jgi:hypothetical protein
MDERRAVDPSPEVVADIHRQADAAPLPTPAKVERLRRIFAPTVWRLMAEQPTDAA